MIFGRDLLKKEARDERLAHMVALVLAALTGKSTADFGKPAVRRACGRRRISRFSSSFLRTQEPIRRRIPAHATSFLERRS